jgi:hypothetical protein
MEVAAAFPGTPGGGPPLGRTMFHPHRSLVVRQASVKTS